MHLRKIVAFNDEHHFLLVTALAIFITSKSLHKANHVILLSAGSKYFKQTKICII
jgi:hypothetical protein